MPTAENPRFYGMVVLILLSVLAMLSHLCWLNYIPQKICKVIKSLISRFRPNNESQTTNDRQTNPPPRVVTRRMEDFNTPQMVDEVEIFLADMPRNAGTQPKTALSNRARQEFIFNLLITKKVMDASDVKKVETKDNEGLLLVNTVGDLESGIPHSAVMSNKLEEDANLQCAICLLDYRPGDYVSFSHNSKCNHHFHQKCIFHWLIQDRDDCPCCRYNYLALSDDEEYSDAEFREQNSEEDEQSLAEPVHPSTRNENDWIPSYLAPSFTNSRESEPPSAQTVGESENTSAALSSRDINTGVEVGRRGNDDDGDSQVPDLSLPDPDTWSCPSADDLGEEQIDFYPMRIRQRKRRRGQTQRLNAVENHTEEQNQGLQLGDLILEGLMQRLQDRADELSTQTASSGSIYTDGAGVVDPSAANSTDNQRVDESEICAICGHEYAVNEELCWSQDPKCAHVFHRSCMQKWIEDNKDYCPFCNGQPGVDPRLQASRDAVNTTSGEYTVSLGPDDSTTSMEFSVASAQDGDNENVSKTSDETTLSGMDHGADVLEEV